MSELNKQTIKTVYRLHKTVKGHTFIFGFDYRDASPIINIYFVVLGIIVPKIR